MFPDIREAHCRLGGKRMSGREHAVERQSLGPDNMDIPLTWKVETQDQVALTGLQKLGRLVWRYNFDIYPHTWILCRDQFQKLRDDPVHEAVHRGKANMAEIHTLQALHLGLYPRFVSPPFLAEQNEHLTRRGQLHATCL